MHILLNGRVIAALGPRPHKGTDTAAATDKRPLYAAFPLSAATQDAMEQWAQRSGFWMPAYPHVTVAYSRSPVDWRKAESLSEGLVIEPGMRSIEQFGDDVVLEVESDALQQRWQQYKRLGASWDYPSYRPHITIGRNKDVREFRYVVPFGEPIVLGPERLDNLDEDWGGLEGCNHRGNRNMSQHVGRFQMRVWQDHKKRQGLSYWCPACNCPHSVYTNGGANVWSFNGDFDNPVIYPSIKVYEPKHKDEFGDVPEKTLCHSYVGCCGARPGEVIFPHSFPQLGHSVRGVVPLAVWPNHRLRYGPKTRTTK